MVQIDRLYLPWLVYTLLLSLIHRQTQLYQTLYIYQNIYYGPLDFDVFEFYCILDFNSKVLIRLLPYLTYKFNINERVDVN